MPLRNPPPIDALRAVYAVEAPHRPHWPREFEQAIADPLTLAILQTLALHPRADSAGRRGHVRHRQMPLEALPEHLTTLTHLDPPTRSRCIPRGLDFKSRAAGEVEDTD